jgi:hypothetical protein
LTNTVTETAATALKDKIGACDQNPQRNARYSSPKAPDKPTKTPPVAAFATQRQRPSIGQDAGEHGKAEKPWIQPDYSA